MEERDNTNYSYKLLTTFKIVLVPEVVYSSTINDEEGGICD
jgi:hypothetical protein